jgi:hypothetical protein
VDVGEEGGGGQRKSSRPRWRRVVRGTVVRRRVVRRRVVRRRVVRRRGVERGAGGAPKAGDSSSAGGSIRHPKKDFQDVFISIRA